MKDQSSMSDKTAGKGDVPEQRESALGSGGRYFDEDSLLVGGSVGANFLEHHLAPST